MLIVRPQGPIGSPVYDRSNAFYNYFKGSDLNVEIVDSPDNVIGLIKLIKSIFFNRPTYLFITMPPFRNWSLCFLPFVKTILDIRDGWSIAMRSGYGGLVEPNSKKASLARLIEYLAIKSSYATITCTPGLKKYLSALTNKEIYLVRNGISKYDFDITKKYTSSKIIKDKIAGHNPIRSFVCAGKFSEYGRDKVRRVISVINQRYGDTKCFIQLIGSDINENKWIIDYLNEFNFSNISIQFYERMDKEKMYRLMSDAFCAITIIRDPEYDFGTKIYDYLGLGIKYLDYFDNGNEFSLYFYQYSDLHRSAIDKPITIVREDILEESDFNIFFKGK